MHRFGWFGGITALCMAAPVSAQSTIVVTATRTPEPDLSVPVAETVVTGDDIRARGATDLRGALSPAAGVEVLPGSDGGPASSVAAFQGLTELDAYLLVVDGVPFGGAFNPATAALDLIDVDRIEVVRGAAPVTYGATSFVGVIHVIRYDAGKQPTRAMIPGKDPRQWPRRVRDKASSERLRPVAAGSLESCSNSLPGPEASSAAPICSTAARPMSAPDGCTSISKASSSTRRRTAHIRAFRYRPVRSFSARRQHQPQRRTRRPGPAAGQCRL